MLVIDQQKKIICVAVDGVRYMLAGHGGAVTIGGRTSFVTVKEIRYVSAIEDYITIVMHNGLERHVPFHYKGLAYIDTEG